MAPSCPCSAAGSGGVSASFRLICATVALVTEVVLVLALRLCVAPAREETLDDELRFHFEQSPQTVPKMLLALWP